MGIVNQQRQARQDERAEDDEFDFDDGRIDPPVSI
jgi:hypothetical protein